MNQWPASDDAFWPTPPPSIQGACPLFSRAPPPAATNDHSSLAPPCTMMPDPIPINPEPQPDDSSRRTPLNDSMATYLPPLLCTDVCVESTMRHGGEGQRQRQRQRGHSGRRAVLVRPPDWQTLPIVAAASTLHHVQSRAAHSGVRRCGRNSRGVPAAAPARCWPGPGQDPVRRSGECDRGRLQAQLASCPPPAAFRVPLPATSAPAAHAPLLPPGRIPWTSSCAREDMRRHRFLRQEADTAAAALPPPPLARRPALACARRVRLQAAP